MSNHDDDPEKDSEKVLHDDTSCGLCSFKPKSLQRCANMKTFLTFFCLTSVLQGMFYTYLVSVITTIEKLYQIPSRTSGFIMSASEMGQISGVLLLTYYGGQGNRPKWIACGMIVFALAAFFSSSPHFFFDSQARQQRFPLSHPHPNLDNNSSSFSSAPLPSSAILSPSTTGQADRSHSDLLRMKNHLCLVPSVSRNKSINYPSSSSSILTTPNNSSLDSSESRCSTGKFTSSTDHLTNSVLTIFFISLLFIGLGSTTTNTLGIPYIDDNVPSNESPLYFGITIGVKIFGPVLGFLLGSICTNIPVDWPFGESLTISNPSDPQWIGAWWLGMLIVFLSLLVTSIFMMSFPKRLPRPSVSSPDSTFNGSEIKVPIVNHKKTSEVLKSIHKTSAEQRLSPESTHNNGSVVLSMNGKQTGKGTKVHQVSESKTNGKRPNLKDFPATIRRLLKNDILLLRIASSVLHILPIAGIYTFLPKYLESQFQLTASRASAITGIAGILVMGFGIFSSSLFMRKYKTEPHFVALWIASAALIYSIGMVTLMGLGCQTNLFIGSGSMKAHTEGINGNINSSLGIDSCNKDCLCSGHFAPICTSSRTTYSSPCFAGCSKVTLNSSSFIFSECSCLEAEETATNGLCSLECTNLTWYIVIFATIVLVHSTCEVGSMLLTLRCVEPQDKAMALGLVSFSVGLFGNVPCPIIYGTVVDSACLFWEKNCGKPGACRVYDSVKFRNSFHGLTAFIMFLAFLVDIVVWYRASSIKFTDELSSDPNQMTKQSQTLKPPVDQATLPLNHRSDSLKDEDEDEFPLETVNSDGTLSSELRPLNTTTKPINSSEKEITA